MKTIYRIALAAVIFLTSNVNLKAMTVVVNVEDFEFNPGDFVINLGDSVKFMWDNSAGIHSTTSTTIPAGAAPWDQPISSINPVFIYVPTVSGSYHYNCSTHPSLMIGQFTVMPSSGINDLPTLAFLSLNVTNPIINELNIIYDLSQTTTLSIKMFNVDGKVVYSFVSATQVPGKYAQSFALSNLSKGTYLVILETKDVVLSKKVLLQ